MSNAIPNGQIRFLSGVPIDENYENSLDFLTLEAQTNYFLSIVPIHQMIGCTRIRDGVIAVNALADDLLTADYMMFQNTNFSNKWFYAFITNVEYVNNKMTYIYYTIDDIQTWMFDVELEECYVEREHTTTDGLFEHLIDEGIATSEYVTLHEESKEYKGMTALMFVASSLVVDPTMESGYRPEAIGCMARQGNLNGVGVHGFYVRNSDGTWNTSAIDLLSADVKKYVDSNNKDSIVNIVMYPTDLLKFESSGGPLDEYAKSDEFLYFDNFNGSTSLNGYVPKNKKLYNSPYSVFEVVLSDGQKCVLQPEMIESSPRPYVQIFSNVSPNPSMLVVPHNYKGDSIAWDKSMSMNAFPQVAVSIDGYEAWVASGGLDNWRLDMYKNAFGDSLGMVGSALNRNAQGVASGAISTVADIGQSIIDINIAKSLPSEIKGSVNTTPLTAYSRLQVLVKRKSLKSDVIKTIDNYFTMFGYKVNKIKTPSRRNRPHYTYVKTRGCKVVGGAPSDAIERIQNIYDNGIRFWVSASEVGKYTTINNSPS